MILSYKLREAVLNQTPSLLKANILVASIRLACLVGLFPFNRAFLQNAIFTCKPIFRDLYLNSSIHLNLG